MPSSNRQQPIVRTSLLVAEPDRLLDRDRGQAEDLEREGGLGFGPCQGRGGWGGPARLERSIRQGRQKRDYGDDEGRRYGGDRSDGLQEAAWLVLAGFANAFNGHVKETPWWLLVGE
jgi:hypothetical protein